MMFSHLGSTANLRLQTQILTQFKSKPRLVDKISNLTSPLSPFSENIAYQCFLQYPFLLQTVQTPSAFEKISSFIKQKYTLQKHQNSSSPIIQPEELSLKIRSPLRLVFGSKDFLHLSIKFSDSLSEEFHSKYDPLTSNQFSEVESSTPLLSLEWWHLKLVCPLEQYSEENCHGSIKHNQTCIQSAMKLLQDIFEEKIVLAIVRVDPQMVSRLSEKESSILSNSFSKMPLKSLECIPNDLIIDHRNLFFFHKLDPSPSSTLFLISSDHLGNQIPFPYQAEIRSWKGTHDQS
eukprot:Sdes_comp8920_c0_seq2m330